MKSTKSKKSAKPEETLAWRLARIEAHTGIPVTTLKRAIYAGRLRARKEGRATIVLTEDLNEYLKSMPSAAKAA